MASNDDYVPVSNGGDPVGEAVDSIESPHPSPSAPSPRHSFLWRIGVWLLGACLVGLIAMAIALAVITAKHGGSDHDSDGGGGTTVASGPTTAQLVETIPVSEFNLTLSPGAVNTHEALVGLVNMTERSLHVTSMYWNLLPSDDDDEIVVTNGKALGDGRGVELYNSFVRAAERGVHIRFLQDNSSSLGHPEELLELHRRFPHNVQIGAWDASKWYKGGIMHMKLWVSDSKHVYIGSANMDWLSLAQVKELGVVMYNCSNTLAADAQSLFSSWWSWTTLPPGVSPDTMVVSTRSTNLGATLTTPCWEPALTTDASELCPNSWRPQEPSQNPPSPPHPPHSSLRSSLLSGGGGSTGTSSTDAVATWGKQQRLELTSTGTADASTGAYFLSAAPAALLGTCTSLPTSRAPGLASASGGDDGDDGDDGAGGSSDSRDLIYDGSLYDCDRTWDLDGLISTILDARKFVYLSVMDFLPANAYSINATCGNGEGVVWWPALVDALTTAATANGCDVKILVSWWASSHANMIEYLTDLTETVATALTSSPSGTGSGATFEVGIFEVPGWNNTSPGPSQQFPQYSRVNHAKYIATDRRLNVGTSNMQWSYFYQTAGASFNSDIEPLRSGLEAIFLRDWESDLTTPLDDFRVPWNN